MKAQSLENKKHIYSDGNVLFMDIACFYPSLSDPIIRIAGGFNEADGLAPSCKAPVSYDNVITSRVCFHWEYNVRMCGCSILREQGRMQSRVKLSSTAIHSVFSLLEQIEEREGSAVGVGGGQSLSKLDWNVQRSYILDAFG